VGGSGVGGSGVGVGVGSTTGKFRGS
jgi:hypothetical protein